MHPGIPQPVDEPRPTLRERKRESTRDRIEQAAIELFEAVGFDNTTVDEIANRADVSRTSVFRYYGSKEDIIFGAVPLGEALCAFIREEPAVPLGEVMIRFAAHVAWHIPDTRRRMELVVRTPQLMGRLADIAGQWEHMVANELAARRDQGTASPRFEDRVLARTVITTYLVPLVEWPGMPADTDIVDLVQRANTVVAPIYDREFKASTKDR